MELEGFGASLVGRAIYVCASPDVAWVPWEFIAGTPYNYRLLITGDGPPDTQRHIEHEHSWSAVFRPHGPKDWSCIATIVRSMGPTLLIVFDTYAPAPPPSFITFMDSCVADGRTICTRIWIGTHTEIPTIPDAIFFPVLDAGTHAVVYEMIRRLPGRGNHGAWNPMTIVDWDALVQATRTSSVGIVVSDIGESTWNLFWHKLHDSRPETAGVLIKRGFSLMRTGMAIVERHSE
jgi:hypothetical protein